jgi:GntR family transcriptional repressor for pyruvate dehydrogenase complex
VTTSTAASLADEIEATIINGDIANGFWLGTKDDLRKRYDVAYGTLNETLRILQERGYVTSRTGPGGGLFATIPTSSDRLRRLLSNFPESGTFKDITDVRHALEEGIVVDATRSRTRNDVNDLRAILRAMGEQTGDAVEYLHQNWRLHRKIAECCRNRVLANLYVTLLDANEPGPGFVVPDRFRAANAKENFVCHQELIAAIASGSVERARDAVRAHEAFFVAESDKPTPRTPAVAGTPIPRTKHLVARNRA